MSRKLRDIKGHFLRLGGRYAEMSPAVRAISSGYTLSGTSIYTIYFSLEFESDPHLVRCPIYTRFSDIPTVFGKVNNFQFLIVIRHFTLGKITLVIGSINELHHARVFDREGEVMKQKKGK